MRISDWSSDVCSSDLAPPWESVYTNKDGAVFKRETVSVKNWFLRFDLVLESSFNEPADHIGLEFGFLAHLAEFAIAASAIEARSEVRCVGNECVRRRSSRWWP